MARVSIWWEMGRCSRDIPLTLRLGYNIMLPFRGMQRATYHIRNAFVLYSVI